MPQLTTLGALSLRDHQTDLLTGRRKVLALLTFLSRADGPVPRDHLARLFWPGSAEERARHSLRQALSELRNAIGDALVVGPVEVRLGEGVESDVATFEAAANAGDTARADQAWGGEFLGGLQDLGGEAWVAWLTGERARLLALRGRTVSPGLPSGPLPAAQHLAPPSLSAAPRWASGHEPASGFSLTREITVGLLGTLSTEARAVLEAAALLGDTVAEPHLAEVAALSGHALTSALEELTERGMLTACDGGWEFSSSGARQRVLRMISHDRRRQLHAAAERVLGGRPVGAAPLAPAQGAPSGGRRIMALLFGSVTLLAALTVAHPRF